MRKLTSEQFIDRSSSIHDSIYDYTNAVYINGRTKLSIYCPIHKLHFEQAPRDHLAGKGCMLCGHDKTNSKRTNSTEQFVERARSIHGNHYSYEKTKFIDMNKKVSIACPVHGIFSQLAAHHIFMKTGCPKCKSSHGETVIRTWLTSHDIIFIEQYRNSDCKDKRSLPFDFYLPDYNLLIEYQGKQHFEYYRKFHRSLKGFEQMKKRDSIKRNWAINNSFIYLEIDYLNINNIQNILEKLIE